MSECINIQLQDGLKKYPSLLTHKGSITLGDLHGNAVKLLHALLTHQIVEFKDEANKESLYQEFIEFYYNASKAIVSARDIKWTQRYADQGKQAMEDAENERDTLLALSSLTEEQNNRLTILNGENSGSIKYLNQLYQNKLVELDQESKAIEESSLPLAKIPNRLNELLSKIIIRDKKALVRLIGDEFADRGSNDYITLKLLDLIVQGGVNVTINVSNHGAAFTHSYEKFDFQPATRLVSAEQQVSLWGLSTLLEEGVVKKEELNELIDRSYKPALKVIDYSLTEDGITLFTHAPVPFSAIRDIANELRVTYDDSTKKALAYTIEKINFKFQSYVLKNKMHMAYDPEGILQDSNNIEDLEFDQAPKKTKPTDNPIWNIMWNRWNEQKENEGTRPAHVNGYKIQYVHGHDPFDSNLKHVCNLDADLGKYDLLEPEKLKGKIESANNSQSPEAKRFVETLNKYVVWDEIPHRLDKKYIEDLNLDWIEYEYQRANSFQLAESFLLAPGIVVFLSLGGIFFATTLLFATPFLLYALALMVVVAIATNFLVLSRTGYEKHSRDEEPIGNGLFGKWNVETQSSGPSFFEKCSNVIFRQKSEREVEKEGTSYKLLPSS